MAALIDTASSEGPDGTHVKCHADAVLTDSNIKLHITVSTDKENLAELQMESSVSNPFVITGAVLYALGSFALCVGFSIASSVYRVAEQGYLKSKTDHPNDKALDHLKQAYNALEPNRESLNADARKAVVACAKVLVPLPK